MGAGSPPGLLPFLREPRASEPVLTTLEPAPAAWEGKRSPFALEASIPAWEWQPTELSDEELLAEVDSYKTEQGDNGLVTLFRLVGTG